MRLREYGCNESCLQSILGHRYKTALTLSVDILEAVLYQSSLFLCWTTTVSSSAFLTVATMPFSPIIFSLMFRKTWKCQHRAPEYLCSCRSSFGEMHTVSLDCLMHVSVNIRVLFL